MSTKYIYMDVEAVRFLLNKIEQDLRHWHSSVTPLRSLIRSLHQVWDAPATADYVAQEYRVLRAMENEIEALIDNHRRALREFDQWLQVDARFGRRGFYLDPILIVELVIMISQLSSAPLLTPLIGSGINKLISLVRDPVDVTTGMFFDVVADLELFIPGFPFTLARVYSSQSPRPGWTFPFFIRLEVSNAERIYLLWGHKHEKGDVAFLRREDGSYESNIPSFRLQFDPTTQAYKLYTEDGHIYTFDSEGWITRVGKQGTTKEVLYERVDDHTIRLSDTNHIIIWATLFLDDKGRLQRIADSVGRTIEYQFDEADHLLAVTNRAGQTTRYEYDSQGFLIRTIGPDGQVLLENAYDNEGRVLRQKDALGHETRFAYTFAPEAPHPIEKTTVTYPDGTEVQYFIRSGLVYKQTLNKDSVSYTYDENGRLTEVRDPNGKVWKLSWQDERNFRALGFTDPAGHTYRIVYNAQGEIWRVEDPDGAQLEVEYNEKGYPIKVKFPDGAEQHFEYDDQGLLQSVVDPVGRRITFAHDERGRVTHVQLPDGNTVTYAYDDAKGEVHEIDPLGRTTIYTYDAADRLKALRRNGNEIRLDYTPYGELKGLQDSFGRRIEAEYDANGRPVRLHFPNGYILYQTYDALGRPLAVQDAQGHTLLHRTYDERGRLIALTDAKGRSWRYTYDGAGNLISLTDRKGRTFRFEYDDAYRPTRIYDPEGRVQVQVEYDEVGQPRRLIDAEGHTLSFTFDAQGRLIATAWDDDEARAELDPAGQLVRLIDEKGRARTYDYDFRGNVIRETYPLNQTYTYAYDPTGRLKHRTLPDGTQVIFTYDDLDRIASLTHRRNGQSTTVQYTYSPDDRSMVVHDASGEVHYTLNENEGYLERSDVFGQTVRYEFTPEGRVRRLVYPDGKAVEYEYDPNGNLTRIRDFAGHETRVEYDEQDLPVRVEHPGGLVSLYEYDTLDRVVRIRHLDTQGNLLVEQRLQRDATGRVVDTQISGPIMEKLTRVPDERSRRTFTFNDLGQIVATDEGPFRYDERGNLIEYVDAGQSVSLQYNLQDRLAEAHIADDHFQYTYDPEGNRVAVIHNGRTRRYVLDTVWDLPRPLVEMDEEGQIQQYFIWGMGLHYALDAEGNPLVYLFNHRGDTLAVVDKKGEVVAAYDYADYGQVVGRFGADIPFRFLGRWGIMADHDGLYYIRARYYAPRLGSFTQPDRLHIYAPLPRFLNRYTYALDDPWSLVDEDGNWVHVVIGSFVGGIIGGGVELARQLRENGWDLSNLNKRRLLASTVNGVIGGAIVTAAPVTAIPGLISAGAAVLTNEDPLLAFTSGALGAGVTLAGAGPFAGGFTSQMYSDLMSSWYYNQPFNLAQTLQRSLISGVFAWGASKIITKFVTNTNFDEQYFNRFLKSPFKAFLHNQPPTLAWRRVLSRFGRDLPKNYRWVGGEILEELLTKLNPKR